MSEYRKALTSNPYLITLTVVGWINIFDKSMYKDIIISNLKYCQEKEGLNIYAYVIMTNHIHLVASRTDEKGLTELMGRLKV